MFCILSAGLGFNPPPLHSSHTFRAPASEWSFGTIICEGTLLANDSRG
jgi:hypothetical protein